jgi:hypothetical protein
VVYAKQKQLRKAAEVLRTCKEPQNVLNRAAIAMELAIARLKQSTLKVNRFEQKSRAESSSMVHSPGWHASASHNYSAGKGRS